MVAIKKHNRNLVFIFLLVCCCAYIGFLLYRLSSIKETFVDDSNPYTSWNSNSELVIVTAHFKEDLDWLRQSGLPLVICSKDNAPFQRDADPRCMLPNRGREASSFLKFITTFYEVLPQRVAFVHGHEYAWHQRFEMISAIRCAKKDKPFVSLNVIFMNDRNMSNPTFIGIKHLWDDHFKPFLNIDFPERVFHDCCAQFVVSREAIRRIPKQAYEHWLQLLLQTPNDSVLSVQFEYLWHIIFGEDTTLTVIPERYVQDMFDCIPSFAPRHLAEAERNEYSTKYKQTK
jgi:hypothetical protein